MDHISHWSMISDAAGLCSGVGPGRQLEGAACQSFICRPAQCANG
jgi:hypothetical protein